MNSVLTLSSHTICIGFCVTVLTTCHCKTHQHTHYKQKNHTQANTATCLRHMDHKSPHCYHCTTVHAAMLRWHTADAGGCDEPLCHTERTTLTGTDSCRPHRHAPECTLSAWSKDLCPSRDLQTVHAVVQFPEKESTQMVVEHHKIPSVIAQTPPVRAAVLCLDDRRQFIAVRYGSWTYNEKERRHSAPITTSIVCIKVSKYVSWLDVAGGD